MSFSKGDPVWIVSHSGFSAEGTVIGVGPKWVTVEKWNHTTKRFHADTLMSDHGARLVARHD